jgi:hypothetical protein
MMMRSLSAMKLLRVATALSLVFWVAGVGCVLGCESFALASSCCPKHHAAASHTTASIKTASARVTSRDTLIAAPVAEITDGHVIGLSSGLSAGMQGVGGMARECPLANGNALATRARTDESTTATALRPQASPFVRVEQLAVAPEQTYIDDRVHTYLRCCVFLI